MKIGVNLHNYGPFASRPTEPEPFGQLLETLTTTSKDPGHGALEGEPDAIAAAILRYRDAGVTHIVIDPDTNALEQYLDDLERFAAEVRRADPRGGRLRPGAVRRG